MKKITIHTVNELDKANELAATLFERYKYDIIVHRTDNILDIATKSNNRWDDILISLEESEDNYTYLYIWENGKDEMDLVASISMYVNTVPVAIPSSYYLVNITDAIYCKIELGKSSSIEDIAEGIHAFFKD